MDTLCSSASGPTTLTTPIVPVGQNDEAADKQNVKQNAVGDTEKLKRMLLTKLTDFSQDNSRDILIDIYKCARANVVFNEEERLKIGTGLDKKITYIWGFLLKFGFEFDPTYQPSPLEFRSALQFILEDYKDFPINTRGQKLNEEIEDFMQGDFPFMYLDYACENWKSFISEIMYREDYTDEDLVRPSWIPESHTWWKEG